jgi:hypothetical protein
VQDNTFTLHSLGAFSDNQGNLIVIGVGEGDVTDKSVLEEGKWAIALGAVDNLIGDNEVLRLDLLLQRADGGEADNTAYTDGAKGSDVGAGRNLMRRELVVLAVAG